MALILVLMLKIPMNNNALFFIKPPLEMVLLSVDACTACHTSNFVFWTFFCSFGGSPGPHTSDLVVASCSYGGGGGLGSWWHARVMNNVWWGRSYGEEVKYEVGGIRWDSPTTFEFLHNKWKLHTPCCLPLFFCDIHILPFMEIPAGFSGMVVGMRN